MIRRAIREYRRVMPRLSQISLSEWRDMLAAQLLLLAAQLLVWVIPRGKLTTAKKQQADGEKESKPSRTPPAIDPAEMAAARRVALAVSRAATYGVFRPKCLVRSVSLRWLLKRHKLAGSRVVIGAFVRGGRPHFHAWVEYGDEVLSDDPLSISNFEALPGLRVLLAD